METILAFPILAILLILQSALFSQFQLFQGYPDLILLALAAWALQKQVKTAWQWGVIGGLLVSFVSGLPAPAPLIGYLGIVGLGVLLRQRVWELPVLSMFVVVFVGTLFTHLIDLLTLQIAGNPIPFFQSLNLITFPTLFLNMLLALPFFAIFRDLAEWLHPKELEM